MKYLENKGNLHPVGSQRGREVKFEFHVIHGTKRWKDPNRRFVENGVPRRTTAGFSSKENENKRETVLL